MSYAATSCQETHLWKSGLTPSTSHSPWADLCAATLPLLKEYGYHYGYTPLGAKAQGVHAWDEAPRFSGFSFMAS
jgi:hypothetical protein